MLEDTLRSAIADHALQDLSLYRLGFEWQANARQESEKSWLVCIDEDPVIALLKALASVMRSPWPSHWPQPRNGAMDRLEAALAVLAYEIRRITLDGDVR